MNSIIVSETCTAPPVPIHVPLTQLAPLSQTCFSCPNSVTPHATLADSSNFQSLTGPLTLNLCTLLLYSPGGWPVGFSLFFRPAEGWREVDTRAVSHCGGCGEDIFKIVCLLWWCNVGWWGLNLATTLSLLRNTMGPWILKEMPPQPPHQQLLS